MSEGELSILNCLISLFFTAFCILITVDRQMLHGMDFVLFWSLNFSVQNLYRYNLMYSKQNKQSTLFFTPFLFFLLFFSFLSPTPLPLTPYQIICSDLWDSEFQYVLLHKGYVAALPGNTCIKNGENWFQNFVNNGWLLEGNLKLIFYLSVAVICLSCHGL